MGQTSPPELAIPVLNRVIGTSVCDVGCGSGMYGFLLDNAWVFTGSWNEERITKAERLIGIDFSSVAIQKLEKHNCYDERVLAGADGLPIESKSVDTALSTENLEHLFGGELLPALEELVRIAKRRVVISTPAPWKVINHAWLSQEIPDAISDPIPMSYEEYIVLGGCVHKSSIFPEDMLACGFELLRDERGLPKVTADSIIYWGDADNIETSNLSRIPAVGMLGYAPNDGRTDYRSDYVQLLQASLQLGNGLPASIEEWVAQLP